jgi:exopolyphosphatase / guanosine-5'-triphosphate,3'-diphosphate pyrophosphatase
MKRRLAIIDMGTNTFHLLVADVEETGYSIIYREKVPVKIGKGGINEGLITSEGKERAMNALLYFKSKLESFQCRTISAFGTSALRNAKNGGEIIKQIKQRTGIEAKVISGEEEAEYIYKGVRAAVKLGVDKSLIVDIGGGSVEFIIADEEKIFWKQSLEIGAQRLLEKFHKHDPIRLNELKELESYCEEVLKPVFDKLSEYKPKSLVGSSGTFDTLSEIYCNQKNIDYSEDEPESPLTLESFYQIHQQLVTKDRTARLAIPGMIEMRVDMIVVASCLIKHLVSYYQFSKIRVSSYSLKEGVLASLVK